VPTKRWQSMTADKGEVTGTRVVCVAKQKSKFPGGEGGRAEGDEKKKDIMKKGNKDLEFARGSMKRKWRTGKSGGFRLRRRPK